MSKHLPWTGERLVTSIFNDIAVEHLARYAFCIDIVKNKQVLDMACGEGYGTRLLSDYTEKITGVDIDGECINHAKKKYSKENIDFTVAEVTKLPFSDGTFDIVISFETIEHIEAQEKMISEIKRVLKSGGMLVISTPDKISYSNERNYSNPYHKKELTKNEFCSLLNSFFFHTRLYSQKTMYASKIEAIDEVTFNKKEYSGSFDCIQPILTFAEPMFFVALASDNMLPDCETLYFYGNELREKEEEQIRSDYEGTWSYKIGRILTIPVRIWRKLFTTNSR